MYIIPSLQSLLRSGPSLRGIHYLTSPLWAQQLGPVMNLYHKVN